MQNRKWPTAFKMTAAMLEIQVRARKMGNYHPILMKLGTQITKTMLT
jgi:hypothetical protein